LHPEKWSRAIGNAQTAGQKLLNSLLNQLQTDLFTAKSAGQKEDPKEISADNPKPPTIIWWGFLFLFQNKKDG